MGSPGGRTPMTFCTSLLTLRTFVEKEWFDRAFQMTHTPAAVSHPTCRALGGPHCVFLGQW